MNEDYEKQFLIAESARRETDAARELMNKMIERVNDGFVALDSNWCYTYVNARAARMLQRENAEELIGKHIWTEYPEGVGQPFHKAYMKAFETQQPITFEEYYLPWDQWYENRVYPSEDGLTIYFTDITERKQTEEALRRTQKMDAIGQLTGGVAHDFNNLLGVILGSLELLERNINNEDNALKRIQVIKKAGLRAADLTRKLLSFSRREAVKISTVNIGQVISDMRELISRSLTPEIEISYAMPDDLWLTEIDTGDFEDALLNLCINARDSMTSHGRILIETQNVILDETDCQTVPGLQPGEYVELTVSDTGKGISSEYIDRIFEPFFTTKHQGNGTGLGLAMVYAFVKRSNGSIHCRPEAGIGTTFHIYLPRDTSSADNRDVQHDDQTEAMPRGNELVLIVDDEEALKDLAKEILESLGYRVVTASNGRQALERFEQTPGIDLLFSDIVMPEGMSGVELAKQATADQEELKVLLTSGFADKEAYKNDLMQLDVAVLDKPYSQKELARKVRSMFDTAYDSNL